MIPSFTNICMFTRRNKHFDKPIINISLSRNTHFLRYLRNTWEIPVNVEQDWLSIIKLFLDKPKNSIEF